MNISGGAQPAVRVDVNPNALAHYGIGVQAVALGPAIRECEHP